MSRGSQLQNTSFNISPNFSSLGSLFSYPSRLLSRIRGIDSYEQITTPVPSIDYSIPTPPPIPGQHVIPDVPPQSLPGPWGFFTSSYMIGLVLMMVLMHRIENVVVPTRVPHFPIVFHNRGRSSSRIMLRRLYAAFLPLDMSNTVTRMSLHLPTLYLMGKSLLLWTLILLQASNLYPNISNDYLMSLRIWSESQDMRDVCWQTFCAICGAFCVEAFVKGLDGVSIGIGAHMQANTSPFNLVGYAFLLYAYSSSYTHVLKPDGLPSRPDKHVLVTIAIPLLQLTIFHVLSCRKRWSSHRLIPTALSSFLSLLHFHTTLFAHSMFESGSSPAIPTAAGAKQHVYSNPTGIGSYPILNYVPNLFETVLLLLVSLTILLNVATQLLLTGKVTKPLLGLGLTSADGGPTEGWSWTPPWEEDFGVVLLRLGTASLEATGLRGWGNEVTGVVASLPSDHTAPSTNSIVTREKIERGTLKMNRNGVIEVVHGSVTTIKTRSALARAAGNKPRVSKRVQIVEGLDNEIRDVDVAGNTGGVGGGRRVYGVPGFFTVNRGWYWGIRALGSAIWNVTLGLLGLLWDLLHGKKVRDRFAGNTDEDANANGNQTSVDNCDSEDDLVTQEETYEKFLRGQISDDEGDEDEWVHDSEFGSDDGQDSNNVSDAEDERETVALYSDLQTRGTSPEAASSAMLAHMAYSGGSPLTRRRYRALLVPSPPCPEAPRQGLRSTAPDVDTSYDESRRNCVICTVEQRQIICWPCRCLSMCDQCRESLAARSSASKHRCPCCRRSVEGYSRIFIP